MGALAANGYPPQVGAPLALAAGEDLLLFNRDRAMHLDVFVNQVQAVKDGKLRGNSWILQYSASCR
jgi:hypothetical protein